MRTARLLAAVLFTAALFCQSTAKRKLGVPEPPKKDVPYLIHADSLLETESNEAKEETRKDEKLYFIPGRSSPVKTPLAGPEFLFESQNIPPEKLQLFKLEPKNGRREVIIARKKKPVARPIRTTVFAMDKKVYKIRVDESLTAGEYSLSPEGSNAVFCFAVE